MTRTLELPTLRRFVQANRELLGAALAVLVLAVLAFDALIGFGGPHLIGLRLAYLALMLLLTAYVTLASSGPSDQA